MTNNWSKIKELLLRELSQEPFSTKDDVLEFEELDRNLANLALALLEVAGTAGVQTYQPAANYLPADMVVYNGILWQQINVANPEGVSGITPGTDETVWQEANPGALIAVPRKVAHGELLLFKANGNYSDSAEAGDIAFRMSMQGRLEQVKRENDAWQPLEKDI